MLLFFGQDLRECCWFLVILSKTTQNLSKIFKTFLWRSFKKSLLKWLQCQGLSLKNFPNCVFFPISPINHHSQWRWLKIYYFDREGLSSICFMMKCRLANFYRRSRSRENLNSASVCRAGSHDICLTAKEQTILLTERNLLNMWSTQITCMKQDYSSSPCANLVSCLVQL